MNKEIIQKIKIRINDLEKRFYDKRDIYESMKYEIYSHYLGHISSLSFTIRLLLEQKIISFEDYMELYDILENFEEKVKNIDEIYL